MLLNRNLNSEAVRVIYMGIIRPLNIKKPKWISWNDEYYLASSKYIISKANLRAPIYLTTGDIVDQKCPPRIKCYDPNVAKKAKEVLEHIDEIFYGKIDKIRRIRTKEDIREIAEEISREIRRELDEFRPKPTKCRIIPSLACYVSNPPRIYVAIDRLEDLANQIEQEVQNAVQIYGSHAYTWNWWKKDRLREQLLKWTIVHEITHSFIDTGSNQSPAKVVDDFTKEMIEESLAIFFGFEHFNFDPFVKNIFKYWVIRNETIEYATFWAWESARKRLSKCLLEYHLYRRVPEPLRWKLLRFLNSSTFKRIPDKIVMMWAGLCPKNEIIMILCFVNFICNSHYFEYDLSTIEYLINSFLELFILILAFWEYDPIMIHHLMYFFYELAWSPRFQPHILKLITLLSLLRDNNSAWKFLALCLAALGSAKISPRKIILNSLLRENYFY